MKQTQLLFLPLLLFIINISIAQTTAIPDQNFEQSLIDLGIDSDNTVNGQVLTADIENIVVLDFGNLSSFETIIDLTGIEDFAALEVLDFAEQGVYLYDSSNADIFSNNINLRELYMKNQCGDCGGVALQILDLSGLPNLELVDLTNVSFNILKINNSNFDIENLTLDLYHEGPPSNDWSQQICIEVSDPQAASNNDPPYNTWNITTNQMNTTYSFTSNCVLSVDDFENLNSLSIYPNPVQDRLHFENPEQINLDQVDVFNITGKKVKSFFSFDEAINLESLEQGIYFVKVMSKNRTKTFKVMKE
jgi:hypothetical protein